LTKPKTFFPSAGDVPGARLKPQLDRYLKDRGWRLSVSASNPNQAYFGWAEAAISKIFPLTRNSAKARVMAFRTALSRAIGEFVMTKARAIVPPRSCNNFFHDDTDLVEKELSHHQGRLKIIKAKTAVLAEGELDKKLGELNVI